MKSVKKIKISIIVFLVIIEAFVWTASSLGDVSSIGIIGGADGPTSIIIGSKGQEKEGEEDSKLQDIDGQKSDKEEQEEENQVAGAFEKGLLILVNKDNPLASDYKPEDLKGIKYFAPDRTPSSRYMRGEAADAFHNLVEAATMEDIELVMTTAYRSYDFQKVLYDGYVQREGQAAADTFSAKPGQSEHQTGLATDVTSGSVNYSLTQDFADTIEGKWLADNAHKFGFVIRFPKGKEEITGYMYEPWHIRYVGGFVAEKIYNQGLTLEEYIEKIVE